MRQSYLQTAITGTLLDKTEKAASQKFSKKQKR